jgi:transposase InsO family protein
MPGNLGDVFHDPSHPAGYSTAWKLWRATGESQEATQNYLQGQDAFTLHKQARRHFPRNVTYADNIDDCWQTDLTDFQSLKEDNDGFTFILCTIDVFSKYGWAVPLKDKSGLSIVSGFETIFNQTTRRPTRLFSDKGKEYMNRNVQKFLKAHNIAYFHTHNPDTKCSIVERWQRSIKARLFKRFTATESYRYVGGLLDDVVHAYNHSYHRSIKLRPVDVTEDRVLEVYNTLYPKQKSKIPKLKIGDYVRITREKKTFEKGYTWNWSEEIFKIVQVIPHPVPVYRIEDLDQDQIEGTFYEAELQKVTKPEAFKIAYIVKSKGKKASLKHLVHWRGYPVKSRSWILDSDIQKDGLLRLSPQ